MRNLIMIMIFILLSLSFVRAQEPKGKGGFNISTGAGIPEALNVGIRYETDQVKFGGSYGFLPGENLRNISADMYFHFGGYSKYSDQNPWYLRIGLNFHRDETKYTIYKYTFLNPSVGREMNISKNFGIALEGGAVFELFKEEKEKIPHISWFSGDFGPAVIPSLDIMLFLRF